MKKTISIFFLMAGSAYGAAGTGDFSQISECSNVERFEETKAKINHFFESERKDVQKKAALKLQLTDIYLHKLEEAGYRQGICKIFIENILGKEEKEASELQQLVADELKKEPVKILVPESVPNQVQGTAPDNQYIIPTNSTGTEPKILVTTEEDNILNKVMKEVKQHSNLRVRTEQLLSKLSKEIPDVLLSADPKVEMTWETLYKNIVPYLENPYPEPNSQDPLKKYFWNALKGKSLKDPHPENVPSKQERSKLKKVKEDKKINTFKNFITLLKDIEVKLQFNAKALQTEDAEVLQKQENTESAIIRMVEACKQQNKSACWKQLEVFLDKDKAKLKFFQDFFKSDKWGKGKTQEQKQTPDGGLSTFLNHHKMLPQINADLSWIENQEAPQNTGQSKRKKKANNLIRYKALEELSTNQDAKREEIIKNLLEEVKNHQNDKQARKTRPYEETVPNTLSNKSNSQKNVPVLEKLAAYIKKEQLKINFEKIKEDFFKKSEGFTKRSRERLYRKMRAFLKKTKDDDYTEEKVLDGLKALLTSRKETQKKKEEKEEKKSQVLQT